MRGRWLRRHITTVVGLLAVLAALMGYPLTAHAAEGDVQEYRPDTLPDGGFADALDLILGPDGNLWLPGPAGIGNHIGRVARDGSLTAFPITGHVSPDTRMTVGSDGAIWFTEWAGAGYNAIGRVTTDGAYSETSVGTRGQPHGIATGSDGAIWYAAFETNKVGRLDPATKAIQEFDIPTDKGRPQVVVADPAGRGVWVSTIQPGRLLLVAQSGQIVQDIATRFEATDMVPGPNGLLWLAAGSYDTIGRLNADLSITEFPAQRPQSIAFDTRGKLWFALADGAAAARIGRLDPADGSVTTFPIGSRFGSPNAVALGSDDQIWFIESRFSEDPAQPDRGRDTFGRVLTGAPLATAPAAPPDSPFPFVHTIQDALTPENIVKSSLLVGLVWAFLLLPSTIVNRTLEANSERIEHWRQTSLLRHLPRGVSDRDRILGLVISVVFVVLGAIIYITPSVVRADDYALADFVVLAIGLLVPAALTIAHAERRMRRMSIPGVVSQVYPAFILIAVACTLAGVLSQTTWVIAYGVVVTWVPLAGESVDDKVRGRVMAAAGFTVLGIALLAWIVLSLLHATADLDRAAPPVLIDEALRGVLLVAVEFLFLGMIPGKFLPGDEIATWSRPRRWVLWGGGMSIFALGVLGPGLPGFEVGTLAPLIGLATAYLGGSLVFWAVMRFWASGQATEPNPAARA